MLDNNLVNSIDISNLPAELQQVISNTPLVFNQALIDGFEKIRTDFEVIESDEKTPLISFEIQDILQPAKDEFNPTEGAVKWGARLPEFHDIDIDLSLKRSDILSFVRSYLNHVTGLTQEQAIANPWPLFFLQQILQKAGRDLALVSAYQGVRDEEGTGAKDVLNGLIFKLAIGRATGGDIKSANVYNSTRTGVEFDANVYEEANKIGQLTENDPDIAGRAMTLEMSPRTYRLYKETRRAKSPNMVALSEQPTSLDDYPNIKIKVEPGLGNKRFMWLTLDGNKFFTFNRNYSNFNVKLIEDVKGYKANIMFSADVNYGTGRYVYSNNRAD